MSKPNRGHGAKQPPIVAMEGGNIDSPSHQTGQILQDWRNRLLGRELDVSSNFLPEDITNAGLLCRQLIARKIRVAKFIWSRLDEATQGMVLRASNEGQADLATRVALTDALNRLITATETDQPISGGISSTIWDKQRFSGIKLSAETKFLLGKEPRPGSMGLIRLHRFLLADAFPSALRRVPQDPSKFIPYGSLFPTTDELERFEGQLQSLAAKAGLKEITATAIARIDTRQPSLRLLDTLRLAVQRLALVPENPRLQIVASVQQGTEEAKRAVYQALRHLGVAGMSLDSNWHQDLDLEARFSPGMSEGLSHELRSLRAELAKASLSKDAQRSLKRLVNHAVFTDLFARSALWESNHAQVFQFCQWLRELNERDSAGFEFHLLAGDRALLHHLSFVHWERFTTPAEAAERDALRRKATNMEQKKRKRIVNAKASGQIPARRRRTVPQPVYCPMVFDNWDWLSVI